jgi:hypothetical protein
MGTSLKVGLGAAAASVAGVGIESLAGPALAAEAEPAAKPRSIVGGLTAPPPVPPDFQTYVSRPDLTPPGVAIAKVANYAAMAGRAQPGYIFVALRSAPSLSLPPGAIPGLTILDTDGNLVWFQPRTGTYQDSFNFRPQTYKGKTVLTSFQGLIGPGYGVNGTYPILDSTYKTIATVSAVGHPSDLHEFLLTSEGTAMLSSYETTSKVIIGHAQEVDVATGDLIFDWPCYPEVPVSDSYVTGTLDYFHINSVDLWPGKERNLLISARNTCTIYLVDRATKKVIWRLHGKSNNFNMAVGTQFWYQHDARALLDGSGLSVFDDGSQPSPEHNSWGKVIALDQQKMTATVRHEFDHTTVPLDVGSQGNFQLIKSTGGHFMGFGSAGYFSEYAPPGAALDSPLILDGRYPTSAESYRAYMGDWTGRPPVTELALAVLTGAASGNFVGFASWNGATEVASWQLLAGKSPSSLAQVALVPKAGFETSMPFSLTGATAFQVKALSTSGSILGTSQVVAAT